MTRSRSKPQGRAHRERIRRLIVPHLRPGMCVPSSVWLGKFLGVCKAEGYRHMRRVLQEDGFNTETRGIGECRRIYILPRNRTYPRNGRSNNGVDGTSSYAGVGR